MTSTSTPAVSHRPETGAPDPFDVRRPIEVPEALRPFVDGGLLTSPDVHTAVALARLGEPDAGRDVLLAAALAARAPRLGHVCVDLTTAVDTVVAEGDVLVDPRSLPWPDADAWVDDLATSPLATMAGATDPPDPYVARPLVLDGTRLYLDRYHRYERRVVADLAERAGSEVAGVDLEVVRAGLARTFPASGERPDRQRLAAATAVLRRLTVIAGGPGTGKTATVAGVLALLHEQARATGGRPPRVALAAPTGKAAARLTASLHGAADRLEVDDDVRAALSAAEASTVHRLLGSRHDSRTRFRHHRDEPLPHDVVVVDETSMVSLSLVARLLEAVRADARLILLGDPEQLASVEAGTVLGDIVGPAREAPRWSAPARERLTAATGAERADLDALVAGGADQPPDGWHAEVRAGVGDGIVVLERIHRFGEGSGIAAFARAVRRGAASEAFAVLEGDHDDVTWVETDDPAGYDDLAAVRDVVVDAGARLLAAAREGADATALEVVDEVRVLCAHRRGPHGVSDWIDRVERWLLRADVGLDVSTRWYVGRPVIVTRNDHRLGVFNGDVGVALAVPVPDDDAGTRMITVAFEGPDGPRLLHPGRLEAVDTVHAMTIHRSQGSQFGHVVVVLPEATSPILTRELLYTAVTRARQQVTLVASRDTVAAAVDRRIARASGLRDALWGPAGTLS